MEISAGVIVKDENSRDPLYLCVRAYSNWDFPKGHLEGQESLVDAALRELEEETTLCNDDIELLPLVAEPVIYKNGKKTAHYFLALRKSKIEPFLPVNLELGKPENDEYKWMTVDEMFRVFPKRLIPVLNWLAAF